MPGYKGHLAGGVLAYGLLLLLVSLHNTPTLLCAFQWFVSALCGSLFPDIDIKSKGQNLFYWVCVLVLVLLCMHHLYVYCALLALCTIIPQLCRHRGITHRAWFLFLLCLVAGISLAWAFPSMQGAIQYNVLFFFFGALSHLYLDFGLKRMIRW